jgi:hypothetical protein
MSVHFYSGLMALILLPAVALAQNAASDCDRLAASPDDPQKKSKGVPYAQLNAPAAVAACRNAVAEVPGESRLWFQYGRALEKAARLPDAVKAYSEAKDRGHAAAYNNLGELYRDGKHFQKDATQALELFRKSAELGSAEGKANQAALAKAMQDGVGMPIPKNYHGRFSVGGMTCKDTRDMGVAFGGEFMGLEVGARQITRNMEFQCEVERFKESTPGTATAVLKCQHNGGEPKRAQAVLTPNEVRMGQGSSQSASQRCGS